MRTITLPVIAHRIFGIGREPRTAWSADFTFLMETQRDELLNGPIARQARLAGGRAGDADDADGRQLTSTFLWPTPGTRRTVNEIRDLFDGAGRAETTGDRNLNQIWEPAGIAFRLVAVVDHAIRTDRAMCIPCSEVDNLALRLNDTNVLNMYFFRSMLGASGVANSSPFPDDPAKNSGYAAIQDIEEWRFRPWENFVEVAAHEVGHFLTLPHEEDFENLMANASGRENFQFRPIQIVLARSCAGRYEAGIVRLSTFSVSFRRIFEDPDAPPMHARAFLGEPWRWFSRHKG